jgi:hypothetical protein
MFPRPKLFVSAALLVTCACGGPASPPPTTAPVPDAPTVAVTVPEPKATAPGDRPAAAVPAAPAMDCSTPKKTIQSQYDGLRSGASVDLMKTCFTARQSGKITSELLASARATADKTPFEDLYASEESNGDSVKVKMKNGRTLTTLVKDGASWRADTLWFK